MKTKLFLLCSVLVFSIFGCTEDNSTDVQESQQELLHTFNPIMPLAEGNIWIYKPISIEYIGKDTIKREGYPSFIYLTEEKDNNGQPIYFTNGGITGPQVWLYTNKEGLWLIDKNNQSKKEFIAKYPCQVGDKWKTTEVFSLEDTEVEYTVISTNETHAVRGKEYTCIHYRVTEVKNPDNSTDLYYALNIGKVDEIFSIKGTVYNASELDSCNVK